MNSNVAVHFADVGSIIREIADWLLSGFHTLHRSIYSKHAGAPNKKLTVTDSWTQNSVDLANMNELMITWRFRFNYFYFWT